MPNSALPDPPAPPPPILADFRRDVVAEQSSVSVPESPFFVLIEADIAEWRAWLHTELNHAEKELWYSTRTGPDPDFVSWLIEEINFAIKQADRSMHALQLFNVNAIKSLDETPQIKQEKIYIQSRINTIKYSKGNTGADWRDLAYHLEFIHQLVVHFVNPFEEAPPEPPSFADISHELDAHSEEGENDRSGSAPPSHSRVESSANLSDASSDEGSERGRPRASSRARSRSSSRARSFSRHRSRDRIA